MWTKGPDLTSPLITYGPNSHYLILITLYNSYKLSQYRKSNREYIVVKGKGIIVIESILGTKLIIDVLFVLNISQNLLSVG